MSTLDKENITQQDNPRRDFIRNSALAAGAGAAAAIGVSSQVVAQEIEPKTLGVRKLSAVFDARYKDKLTKDDILLVLEQMFDIAGCPTCGLGGYDVHLGLDPIFDVKSNIPVNVSMQNVGMHY